MLLWVQFAICATLVVVTGSMLSRYADILAEKTGQGRSWAGAVLLAGATSLPELATGTSAVTVVGDVSLAAGGVLGSCLFNLLLLAVLDMIYGRKPLFRDAAIGHILSARIGCALLVTVMLSLFVTQEFSLPTMGWIGRPTIVVLVAYVAGIRLIGRFECRKSGSARARASMIRSRCDAHGLFLPCYAKRSLRSVCGWLPLAIRSQPLLALAPASLALSSSQSPPHCRKSSPAWQPCVSVQSIWLYQNCLDRIF